MAIDLRSMDKRKLISLALALGCGLVAVVLTNTYISESSVRKGRMIAEELTSEKISQFNTRINEIEKKNQEQVAALQKAIELGQINVGNQPGQKQLPKESLSTKTPAGKRAITVIVDKIFALGGLLAPGDHVDIITHLITQGRDKNDPDAEVTSLTLFQNVLVLAVGENLSSIQGASTLPSAIPITFALDPQEASLIAFAQQHGNLQLVLRSPQDTEAFMLPVATWETLSEYVQSTQGYDAGIYQTPEQIKEKTPIEVFRGGK